MFQHHLPSQRHVTTAHLAQTMTLLSLTVDELKQQIDSELAGNPALEMVEQRTCPACHRPLPDRGVCPICSKPQSAVSEEPVVFVSPVEDFYYTGSERSMDDGNYEPTSLQTEELPVFVMRQIRSELATDELKIAAYLLTHLDEDGLLTIPLLEVARYFHVPLTKVERVQHVIRRAEPIGVGSSSTKEALLAQLEVLGESKFVPPLTQRIVEEAFDLLTKRQFSDIAKSLKVPLRQVQAATYFISENLNPFPGRCHWGDVRQPGKESVQVYNRPDVIISYLNDDPHSNLVVEIILPIQGALRVNPLFKQAISQAGEEKKEAWKNDLDRASLFVKCLQQRNHTMQRLLFRVVVEQREYVVKGEEHLRPMTRAQFARELGVHESTISRAVAGKSVQLPNKRIVPLSSFFDRSLNVRTILKEVIEAETRPLSDTELAKELKDRGYEVARRTVAKYRLMEGILPAHLRQSPR